MFFLKRNKPTQVNTPPEFICPLTRRVFQDPVIAADGYTYERVAIEEWLSREKISPTTQQLLPNKNLIPNLTFKKLIESTIRPEVCEPDAAKELTLSDEMYQASLREIDEESKVSAVKRLIFKEQFHAILSQLQNITPIKCTLSYNRVNFAETRLLRDIKEGLMACKELTIEDAGEVPAGANRWRVIDKAVAQIEKAPLVISMRFPCSVANCEGRETSDEDNQLRTSKGRIILIAINGELDVCFSAGLINRLTTDSFVNYEVTSSHVEQVVFFANLLHKVGFIATEYGKESLIQLGSELANNIDKEFSPQTILESIERKEHENNATSVTKINF